MLSVNIKKNLGTFRLDVKFETDKEIMGLLGASGCGKSMTLKCIAGIERPDEGIIVLGGKVLFDSKKKIDLKPQKRRVGYLFQQYALFPNMTVESNIAAGCREKRESRRKSVVGDIMKAMRLQGLEDKRPHQLSGGQQQRTALARILINEPEILLLDEPFTALDSYLKWQLELEVSDILMNFGRGALLVTHSRDEIFRLCESVCVLSAGKSQDKQATETLFNTPGTLAACLLSGCKNYSRVQATANGQLDATDWGVRIKTLNPLNTDIAYVGIRAHHIEVSSSPIDRNSFPCVVERVIEDVFSTVVMLSPGDGLAPLRAEGEKEYLGAFQRGQRVYAHLPAGKLMQLSE